MPCCASCDSMMEATSSVEDAMDAIGGKAEGVQRGKLIKYSFFFVTCYSVWLKSHIK